MTAGEALTSTNSNSGVAMMMPFIGALGAPKAEPPVTTKSLMAKLNVSPGEAVPPSFTTMKYSLISFVPKLCSPVCTLKVTLPLSVVKFCGVPIWMSVPYSNVPLALKSR